MVHEQPAIAIEGAKAVAKTISALRRATSVLALDAPAEVTLLAADRSRLRHLPTPVLIDEWQKYPPVWDMVRRAVDGGAPPGSFLLTGSATPHGASTHSGAGRIVRLRMRPMSLAERGLVPPVVSVAELMTGARPPLEGASPLTLADYADEIVASGFPGIRTRGPAARRDARSDSGRRTMWPSSANSCSTTAGIAAGVADGLCRSHLDYRVVQLPARRGDRWAVRQAGQDDDDRLPRHTCPDVGDGRAARLDRESQPPAQPVASTQAPPRRPRSGGQNSRRRRSGPRGHPSPGQFGPSRRDAPRRAL